jgi:hypothetical protein
MGTESVRVEVRLGRTFDRAAFEDAFARFRKLYNVAPERALCAPDVLERYCTLYERSEAVAHRHSSHIAFDGVPLFAAILAPGLVAFEGTVDQERMGDW